jgi:hypothetical protein
MDHEIHDRKICHLQTYARAMAIYRGICPVAERKFDPETVAVHSGWQAAAVWRGFQAALPTTHNISGDSRTTQRFIYEAGWIGYTIRGSTSVWK